MTRKRSWCLVFVGIFACALCVDLSTFPSPRWALGLPEFVYGLLGLQLLLALALWGFVTSIWQREAAIAEVKAARKLLKKGGRSAHEEGSQDVGGQSR